MAMGRPKAELVLSDEEQAQLQSIARSRSLPAALVRRAEMVLACAAGATNTAVARRFGTTNATVGKWRRRFIAGRIAGLHDELRPGKPRSIGDERIAALLNTTLHAKPKDGATHWSVRGLAAETGIAKTSVHRFLQAFGLQPHRRDSFKLSTDPFFIEKLRDVVGLYSQESAGSPGRAWTGRDGQPPGPPWTWAWCGWSRPALIEGRLASPAGRSELVELATRLIVEEALEGEVRDALNRDYYCCVPLIREQSRWSLARMESAVAVQTNGWQVRL
jgi:transposase